MKIKQIAGMWISIIFFLLINSSVAQDTVRVRNENQQREKEQTKLQHGAQFVDEDGDGYNDNAPDDDGDGIPNGLDPDYQGKGKKKKFVDRDGDGIDDRQMMKGIRDNRRGLGPQGTGEQQQGPNPSDAKSKQKRGGTKKQGGNN